MSRWDPAPADGGISMAAQEDEARTLAEEIERESYLTALHQLIHQRATVAMHAIGVNEPGGVVRQLIKDEMYFWLREGVKRAESGQAAEWILETERK